MSERTKVRLLFADEGSYHHEEITVPTDALARYERLIDLLREDPDVLREIYVDARRLCTAYVVR